MSERLIPAKALTRKQIAALSHEDLSSRLSPIEIKTITTMTRMGFDTKPPEKLPTESSGQYRARLREAAEVDKVEFATFLRANAESALYDSTAQKQQRLIDSMSAGITEESRAAREKSDAEFQRRQKEMARDTDLGSGVPYAGAPTVGWEK